MIYPVEKFLKDIGFASDFDAMPDLIEQADVFGCRDLLQTYLETVECFEYQTILNLFTQFEAWQAEAYHPDFVEITETKLTFTPLIVSSVSSDGNTSASFFPQTSWGNNFGLLDYSYLEMITPLVGDVFNIVYGTENPGGGGLAGADFAISYTPTFGSSETQRLEFKVKDLNDCEYLLTAIVIDTP